MSFATRANIIQTFVSLGAGIVGAIIAAAVAYSSVDHKADEALRRAAAAENDFKELNSLIVQVNVKVEKLITLVEERLPKKGG